MKIALVGATGMVGEVVLKLLEERNFFIKSLISLLEYTRFITPKNHISLTKKIHILFNKSNLENEEVNMLMGMISSINKKLKK